MNRLFIKILFTVLSFWMGLATAADTGALPTKTDRLSYALGVETGKSFKNHGVNLNPTAFAQGLQDALSGNKTLITNDEITQELKDFQRASSSKLQEQLQKSTQKNQQLGNSFLDANKERPGVVTTASGLQYKIITAGKGAKPSIDDVVTVNYEGRLLDGKVFDSSYERGMPSTFPVNAVIMGWQEALQLMPMGSTWEIYIPAKLAYGEQGAQGVIGPNETLIFKVELLKMQKQNSSEGSSQNSGQ